MKSITAAALLLCAFAVVTAPLAQAHAQKTVSSAVTRDLPMPPLPPGGGDLPMPPLPPGGGLR